MRSAEREAQDPSIFDSPPEPPALECLGCDYNLTGLSGPLCPECGEPFDRDRLRDWSFNIQATLPWERDSSVIRFAQTLGLSLTRPDWAARRFSPRHDSTRAALFSACCYVLAVFVMLIRVDSMRADWTFSLAIFGGLVGVLSCELITARVLAWILRPARLPRSVSRYHFWRGLTHYTSGYCVLTAYWAAYTLTAPRGANWDTDWVMSASASAIFSYWTIALWTMIMTRRRGLIRTALACLAVPLIGVGSIAVGYLAAVLVVFGSRF
ncbi:MAG: hypothetical protein U1D55_00900 [Phycisphaerae bacterium]